MVPSTRTTNAKGVKGTADARAASKTSKSIINKQLRSSKSIVATNLEGKPALKEVSQVRTLRDVSNARDGEPRNGLAKTSKLIPMPANLNKSARLASFKQVQQTKKESEEEHDLNLVDMQECLI